jgi:hypothetical protein
MIILRMPGEERRTMKDPSAKQLDEALAEFRELAEEVSASSIDLATLRELIQTLKRVAR